MATQALTQDPNDPEVRKTFAQIERARVAELAKSMLAKHCVPRRIKDVEMMNPGDDGLLELDLELAHRVDGRWDLLSLIKASGVREAEALLAFARLSDARVVELGE
jgi:hypothetical protein